MNEVILDNDELLVYTTLTSDKKLGKNKYIDMNDNKISVEGKLLGSVQTTSKQIDDYTVENVDRYSLANIHIIEEVDSELVINTEEFDDLEGDKDIKIVYNYININGDMKEGPWEFEFKINGAELTRNTKYIPLNKIFTLENGEDVILEKYTSNDLGQKIYFSKDSIRENALGVGNGTEIVIRGHDDLGNNVKFYTESLSENYVDGRGKGIFKIEPLNSNLDENAKVLKLIPYAGIRKAGEVNDNLKKVGEEFTIILKQ